MASDRADRRIVRSRKHFPPYSGAATLLAFARNPRNLAGLSKWVIYTSVARTHHSRMAVSLSPSLGNIKGLFVVLGFLIGMTAVPVSARAQDAPGPEPDSGGLSTSPAFAELHLDERLFEKLFVPETPPRFDIARHPVPAFGSPHQTEQTPDLPEHTGFKALFFDTASDFAAFPRRPSTWVILAIGGAGAAIAHPFDDEANAHLVGSDAVGKFFAPGKYIGAMYTQVGMAVGFYVAGRYLMPHAAGAPKTNKVAHIGFDMLRSLIVSQTFTQAMKQSIRRDRPTGECCAFPSGHSSAAFATASALERHFGYRGAWPTFVVATYVAMSRMHDNRHYLSDVVFGGALGIASGWTVVGRHGRSNFAMTPVPVRGGVMLALTYRGREQRFQN
jgi:membrane-associated phospholipid phosphatase